MTHRRLCLLAGLVLTHFATLARADYSFTRFAGIGHGSADGSGSTARFAQPSGMARDGAGNLYVADTLNSTIRKISPAGAVTTLAGTPGTNGSANGTGANASFYFPANVAVDAAGNVLVADTNNHTIRKITPAGTVTTVAGMAGSSGTTDGTAANALFNFPRGLAVDASGNIYVADSNNHSIRKITPAGAVTTLAGSNGVPGDTDGTGSNATFQSPTAIVINGAGDLLVGTGSGTIRKVTPAGVVTTVAGQPLQFTTVDGTGTNARFNDISAMTIDASDNVYATESGTHCVRKVTPAFVVTTIAGTVGVFGSADGTGTAAKFNIPSGIVADANGNVFVADSYNSTIRKIAPGNTVTTFAGVPAVGSADGDALTQARFFFPRGAARDSAGNIYVADQQNSTIRKISSGGTVTTFAGLAGSSGTTEGTGSAARFAFPYGVCVDATGNVYVADGGSSNRIRKITPAGVTTTYAGAVAPGSTDGTAANARFWSPRGLAIDANGNIFVADSVNNTIRKIATDGTVTTVAGDAQHFGSADGTGTSALFFRPSGIAFDSTGNLYVTDTFNCTIRKISPAGVVTTFAGTPGVTGSADGTGAAASFNLPNGIAVDASGNVLVCDAGSYTLRKITPAGVVTTIAGLADHFGNVEGAGQAARFVPSHGIFFDPTGNVYVVDAINSVVFKGVPIPDTAPGISTQPTSQSIATGSFVTFTAAASGSPTPTYQWKKNGVIIPGATGASYTITGVQANDAGSYTVVATNSLGSTTSSAATLTVVNPATRGDLDGDGKADLIWQNRITGERSFWLMNRTAFGSGFAFWTVDPAWEIVGTGDFDADGQNDLVWVNTLTGERNIWLMNGTTFRSGISLGIVPLDWQIAAIGDFNADGKADLVWQNSRTGECSFWLMNGTAFTGVALSTEPLNRQIVASGDFNADGKPDLVWTDTDTGERFIWYMDGTSFVSEASLGTVSTAWQIVASDDYDGDGLADLVWSNTSTGERTIWTMNGTTHNSTVAVGTVTLNWVLVRNQTVPAPVQSDFTGDANSDLVWQNPTTGEGSLWVMNGTSFGSGVTLGTVQPNWLIVASGDFNADGKSDIVWTNIATGERSFWLMNGTSFDYGISLGTIPLEWQIAASGDYNGDGKSDLVWTNTNTGERSIWLMNGTSYTSGSSLGTVPTNWQINGSGDFNADGKSDLVWTDTSTGERVIWFMDGVAFSSGFSLGVVPTNWQIVGTGDFNGDGDSDLVWTDTSTGERTLWLMNGTTHSGTVSLGFVATQWKLRN